MKNLFVCLVHYTQPLEQILENLSEHREYLSSGYEKGLLLVSGPRVPKEGGVIIGRFESRAAAQEFCDNDPFSRKQLASYEILEFEPVLHASMLDEFVK